MTGLGDSQEETVVGRRDIFKMPQFEFDKNGRKVQAQKAKKPPIKVPLKAMGSTGR